MTLTVTVNLKKLLGIEEVEGVEIDICETVNGNVDIILSGDHDKVTSLARSIRDVK